MLTRLVIKNIALIDEVQIDFNKGLNIITGETGAGKSILLDSISLALESVQALSLLSMANLRLLLKQLSIFQLTRQ